VNFAFRDLPAVHRLLAEPNVAAYAAKLGPAAVKFAVNETLADLRASVARDANAPLAYARVVAQIADRLAREEAQGLIAVINATGILLHTNLGRAPLAAPALDAMAAVGGAYSTLEFDLAGGTRGSRYDRLSALLRETTGAQAGLVVNNCAAAMLIILDTFAKEREVIVARKELIEIGGGFRLPDVLRRSGARLVEVGTTNKVYLHDFERALSLDTALLLRSHPSNYRVTGFVADVTGRELAELGHRAGVPVVEDLGTGALIDLAAYGLPHERTVREAVADGIDLVAFSGDKLLGGPQAGIIVGAPAPIARLRANPLLRALRVDKATLAALAATLLLYTAPDGIGRIPLYAMLATTLDDLRGRAERIRTRLGPSARFATVVPTVGFVGGGTLPDVTLASVGLALESPEDVGALAERLRRGRPAVVSRIEDRAVIIDLRTIPPNLDEQLGVLLATALATGGTAG
jgi:L-seryl-tRNA(Ser) seleniumtransferase